MNMNKRLLLVLAFCLSISVFAQGGIYFVKTDGSGGNGSSWTSAMNNDQFCQALLTANSGDIFYVAAGTYHPTRDKDGNIPSDNRHKRFTVKSGISIIGSYKTTLTGTQNGEGDREYDAGTGELSPTTIFSGDIDGNNTPDAHVVIDASTKNASLSASSGTVRLDGITVTHSMLSAVAARNVDLDINNCSIENNRGSNGTYVDAASGVIFSCVNGNCTIKNSSFTNNTQVSSSSGGVIDVSNGDLSILNSTISGNTSESQLGDGYGMCAIINYYATGKNMRIYNSTISDNTLTRDTGHGCIFINNDGGEAHIINSTIVDNQSLMAGNAGAGIVLYNYLITKAGDTETNRVVQTLAAFKIDNTILAGNSTNDIALIDITRLFSSDGPEDGFELGTEISINSYYKNGDIYQLPHFSSNLPKTSIIGQNHFYNNSPTASNVSFSTYDRLGALAYNGGLTQTRELLGTTSTNYAMTNGNPAYNGTIANTNGLNRDQRGFLRPDGAVSIGAYQHNGIDDGGGTEVSLNLTVFLQGVTQSNGTMTNYIQNMGSGLFSQPRLPTTDPYSGNTTFSGINNVGTAGAVVDWIQVEIWSVNMGTYSRAILDEKALLLRPNGTIVDTDGNAPKFQPQTGAVRIVIKHRNHLGVMSNEISSFTGSITYDFSSAVSQSVTGYKEPMVNAGGKWALWAGDVNMDGTIDPLDFSEVSTIFDLRREDDYLSTDLNMDGAVDPLDVTSIDNVLNMRIESILFYFE